MSRRTIYIVTATEGSWCQISNIMGGGGLIPASPKPCPPVHPSILNTSLFFFPHSKELSPWIRLVAEKDGLGVVDMNSPSPIHILVAVVMEAGVLPTHSMKPEAALVIRICCVSVD